MLKRKILKQNTIKKIVYILIILNLIFIGDYIEINKNKINNFKFLKEELTNLNKLIEKNQITSNFFYINTIKTRNKNNKKIKIKNIDNISVKICFTTYENCSKLINKIINNSSYIRCALFDLNEKILFKNLFEQNKNTIIYLDDTNKKHIPQEYYKYFIFENNSYKFMHNKFCVFDNKTIFTGSLNPTYNGFFRNDNNIIIINSKEISKVYLDAFNNLSKNKKPSNNKIFLINKKINKTNNTYWMKIYFCPRDNCQEKVIDELSKSKYNIKFLTFSFTDKKIAKIIINKNKTNNISVYGIFEKKGTSSQYSIYDLIKNEIKENILVDKNKYNMHHKVFIIDDRIVIFGSYNPTNNGANNNDENIIITNYPEIVNAFVEYFSKYFLNSIN